jgi:N-methylhydantoinase B
LPALDEAVVLRRGDVLRTETPGGGGFGHPFDRDAQLVLRDVLADVVSIESARRDYGVVIDLATETVDAEKTMAVRQSERWETKLIHRGIYHDPREWYEGLQER